MSRIGRLPIAVPAGVEVTLDGRAITVTGPKGTLGPRAPPGHGVVQRGRQRCWSQRPTDAKMHASSTA